MPLAKLSRREIQSRPLRSLLTLISIVIGVGAIVSTSISTESARLAQEAMIKTVTGNAALEIVSITDGWFDGKPLEPIARMEGVQVASPIIRRFVQISVPPGSSHSDIEESKGDGDPGVSKERPQNRTFRLQILGVIPELDRKVRDFKIVDGRELSYEQEDRDSVVIDEQLAQTAGLKVGSKFLVQTLSRSQEVTVVGISKALDASAAIQSGPILVQLRSAQRWSRANGKVGVLQIVADPKVPLPKLIDDLQAELDRIGAELAGSESANSEPDALAAEDAGAPPRRTTVARVPKPPERLEIRQPTARSQLTEEITKAPESGLRLAIAFSLIISAFIIYNTFQMNVGERRRQLGILRSMGALKRQLLWMIVREGLWLGVIGGILGSIAGYFGASILNQSTSQLLQINIPQSPFTIWPFIGAFIAGIVVATLGAFFPALRASRLSPAEAMRVVASGEFGTSRIGWLVFGSVTITAGVIVQALSITGIFDYSHAVTGALVMLIGIVFLLPGVIGELTAVVAKLLTPIIGVEAMLARKQILRHRGRSSLTIGTVFIAIATVLGLASTILDNVGNVEQWYQRAIVGDFFIRAAMPDMNTGATADMPLDLPEQIAGMPGVSLVDTLDFVNAKVGDRTVLVVVRKFNSPTQDFFDLTEGKADAVLEGIKTGGTVLGSVLSQRMGLHVGDTIPLETLAGVKDIPIVGVTNEYIAGGLTMYLEEQTAKELLDAQGLDAIVVRADPSQHAQLEKKLRQLCEENALMFQSYSDLVAIIKGTRDGVTGGLWAVLALCFVIAAFGLVNTLAMNILEQTREIGMLRVVAMTRNQVRKMIVSQALIIGLIGLIPGALMAIWIAYLINLPSYQVIGRDIEFKIYPWLLVGGVVFELVIILLASMLPAERAARINVSSALQYE
ncbi:FtsX-like permease family protein [Pirellulaceae bacterium SH449]